MEEKKEYSIIGTVTIGTDEYRDLLGGKFEAEKEKDRMHDKWYSEYCERTKLENECKKLKEEFDKLKKFLSKNSAFNNEDGISIIMSILGEE